MLQIRKLRPALANNNGTGYLTLLRLLHATLNAEHLGIEIRRGSFTPNLAKLSRQHKMQLLNYAERWGANDVEIRRIIRSLIPEGQEKPGKDIAAAFDRLRFRAKIATGNLRSVPLIAMGAHCLAWTLPNRWGLRPATDIARLFNPLSLAAHKPQFIARMIASDFEGYVEPTKLKATVSTNGYKMVARSDGAALWNHCIGPYWVGSQFARFRRIMMQQAERLCAELASDAYAFRVFLLHLPNAVSDEQAASQTSEVASALEEKVKGNYGVLAIDTSKRSQSPTIIKPIARTVSIIRAPVPEGNYQWPVPESYNSAQGLMYERSIASAIESSVDSWSKSKGTA